jgi:hypothetical protein
VDDDADRPVVRPQLEREGTRPIPASVFDDDDLVLGCGPPAGEQGVATAASRFSSSSRQGRTMDTPGSSGVWGAISTSDRAGQTAAGG